MKKSLLFWQCAGFIFTAILGVLLHFLYNWSNQSPLVAPFSAVNESIWEHMKLLFFPMFIFALIENQFIGEGFQNFWCVKLVGILLGLILIPVLYYTYTGAFGVSADWFNIVIFFLANIAAYALEIFLFHQDTDFCISSKTAFMILFSLAFIFILFTFVQPKIPLFRDARTGVYGMSLK